MPFVTNYQGASASGQKLAEVGANELGYRCIGNLSVRPTQERRLPRPVGHEPIPNIKHVLKVVLTAPLEMRIEQIRKRDKLNDTAARC